MGSPLRPRIPSKTPPEVGQPLRGRLLSRHPCPATRTLLSQWSGTSVPPPSRWSGALGVARRPVPAERSVGAFPSAEAFAGTESAFPSPAERSAGSHSDHSPVGGREGSAGPICPFLCFSIYDFRPCRSVLRHGFRVPCTENPMPEGPVAWVLPPAGRESHAGGPFGMAEPVGRTDGPAPLHV